METRLASATLDELSRPLTNDSIFENRASFLPLNAFAVETIGTQTVAFNLPDRDIITAQAKLLRANYMGTFSPMSEDFIEVHFGKLSADQYAKLRSSFDRSGDHKHETIRNYELTDFLNPSIQALANRTGIFFGQTQCFDLMVSYVISPTEKVLLTTNAFDIYDKLLGDEQYFTQVKLNKDLLRSAQKLEESVHLTPGDVILFGSPDSGKPFGLSAGHAVTVIADSKPAIIWEKKAPREQAFTLNTCKGVLQLGLLRILRCNSSREPLSLLISKIFYWRQIIRIRWKETEILLLRP